MTQSGSTPWHDAAIQLHHENPQKAAYTVALELALLGFPGILGRQVAELWKRKNQKTNNNVASQTVTREN